MQYDRTVIAYHGCDAETAERLLRGEPFRKSRNDYDWLGKGIYFWEYGADRALQFARDQQRRGKVNAGDRRCAAPARPLLRSHGHPVHRRASAGVRDRDCAVLNNYLLRLEERWIVFDSVRCGFTEGPPAFDGSGIRRESHVQIAVRNPACIIGVFQPRLAP